MSIPICFIHVRINVHFSMYDVIESSKISYDNGTSDHDVFVISKTPHYQLLHAIKENKEQYTKWKQIYESYIEETKQYEHSIETYTSLIDNFDVTRLQKEPIKIYIENNNLYIQDGVHRLCCYYYETKRQHIPIEYLQINDASFIDSKSNEVDLSHINDELKQLIYESTQVINSNGWHMQRTNTNGYHSFNVFGLENTGQRICDLRLQLLKGAGISLEGKRVLDIGCNVGGMLYHEPNIALGVGIDFDQKSINIAKYIQAEMYIQSPLMASKYKFLCKNLDKTNTIELLKELHQNIQFDVVLLCSMGSWVQNIDQLYSKLHSFNITIVLELNNDEQVHELDLFPNREKIQVISASVDDRLGNHGRKTYLIKPRLASIDEHVGS